MRKFLRITLATVATLCAGAASAASVEVKDAVARITVIAENRTDIKVDIVQANSRLPLEVREFGGRTIIDGNLRRRIRDCRGAGEHVSVLVRDVGDIAYRDMPQIVIHTPRDVDLDAGGAVWGTVGRAASVRLGNAGCGDWTVGNVEGALRVSQAGSGDTRTGSAASAKIRVAGSGDTSVGDIKGPLAVDIAGSGDVTAISVSGALDVHVAGSGDVKVASGHVSSMEVTVAGSGDVTFGGVADTLKARIAGSGDVRARQVTGSVSKTVMGSGGVTIGE
ncbi:GIN domain-containing protein [Phenylobacterium sp.]|uniref:GIN domain-containing protein n=1 Tax=Phenylobacterium sp. TaxID=1871053 RepID=UPI00374D8AD9